MNEAIVPDCVESEQGRKMVEDSEKRFEAIMNRIFNAPKKSKPSSNSTRSFSSFSVFWYYFLIAEFERLFSNSFCCYSSVVCLCSFVSLHFASQSRFYFFSFFLYNCYPYYFLWLRKYNNMSFLVSLMVFSLFLLIVQ